MKKNQFDENEDESGGGQSEGAFFRYQDMLLSVPSRDDALTPQEIRILKNDHQLQHAEHTRDQKKKRKYYQDIKKGANPSAIKQQGGRLGAGRNHSFKDHPLLAGKFAGRPAESEFDPNAIQSDTNQNKQKELEELQLRPGLRYDPRKLYYPTLKPRYR